MIVRPEESRDVAEDAGLVVCHPAFAVCHQP